MPSDSLDTQRTAMECFQLRNWQRMPYYFFSICYHLKEDFLAHHHTPIISERKKQGGFGASFFLSTTSFRVISTELPWYRREAGCQFCQKQSASNRFLHSCCCVLILLLLPCLETLGTLSQWRWWIVKCTVQCWIRSAQLVKRSLSTTQPAV